MAMKEKEQSISVPKDQQLLRESMLLRRQPQIDFSRRFCRLVGSDEAEDSFERDVSVARSV